MAEDALDAKERLWNPQDWCWDPYNMLALATDRKGSFAAGKAVSGGLPFAVQPQLGPAGSLLLDDVNRSVYRGKGPTVCQVNSCAAELTGLKEYHQRYKICEFHLKVNSIIREGKRQRFCQQCGRFHDLTCFDGDKRSCRARLQRHNARRRKKPAEAGAAAAAKPGVKKPPTALPRKSSREFARTDSSKQRQNSESTTLDHMSTPQGSLEASSRQQLGVKSGSMESQGTIRKLISSGRAPEEGPSGQQLAARLQSSSFASEQMHVSALVDGDAAPMTGVQSSLPSNGYTNVPPPTYAADTSMESLDCLQDINFFAPQQSSPMPDYSDLSHAATQMQATFAADPAAIDLGQAAAASKDSTAFLVEEARALLSYAGQYQAMEYTAEEHFTRMSAKMFKCTPEQLPADLKANLLAMLQCGVNALEGYIRPGCVHLTLHAMLGPDAGAALQGMGVRALVNNLVAASDHTLWRSETLLIQWYEEVALVRDGKVLHVLSASGSRGVLPQLHSVSPLAALSSAPVTLKLLGANIATPNNSVLAQSQGKNVDIEVVSAEANMEGAAEEASSLLEVVVPAGQRNGVLHLEVARGALLSGPKPVLIVDDAAVAAEINQLEQGDPTGLDVDGFLLDMGRVLELKNAVAAAKFGTSQHVRTFSAADVALVAQIARRLLIVAINKAWPAVARLVLPVAAADAASVGEAVRQVETLTGGLPLLHLAVRSQSIPLVSMLLEWTSTGGYELRAGAPGPHGMTALHLAATLKDGGKLAALLTGLCVDGAAAWTQPGSAGASPADLAIVMGHKGTHELVYEQLCATMAASTKALSDENWEDGDSDEYESDETDIEVDPDTGELLYLDPAMKRVRGGAAADATKASQRPVDEAAVPKTQSQADVQLARTSKRPPVAPNSLQKVSPDEAGRCDSSSYTSGSSSDASSVLSDWPSQSCDSLGLRKRSPTFPSVREGVEYTPEDKGTGKSRAGGYGNFDACLGLKVAPTVFDRTSAIGSALLIAACGGLTLFLRYYGSIFLD
ncbi:probable squamosa promoter-binding-like protein 4 at N-terminal half [Coccomyxa sp. Obi]|nr:probable squamosa promoter-binding-like protein 4 at N-terminal half [Coccomyxa sp. Obi]